MSKTENEMIVCPHCEEPVLIEKINCGLKTYENVFTPFII